MRRGFKAEAERSAAAVRDAMGLGPFDAVNPWAYAAFLGVVVLDFDELELDDQHRTQLLSLDSGSWWGLTIKEDGRHFVIINPKQSDARRVSTMMHELAHIALRHVPASVTLAPGGMMLLSEYPPDLEDEADWLAAAILLPRDALEHYRGLGWSASAICAHFTVSSELCNWRLRMTGVEAQMRRRRA